ncbi:hypothetical protein Tc00.1047053509629.30 [Trypanosoma cruzi]|uniref:Uncharacterized protein n=1 Tax=Trypanosoma cruzi (strain CL Brener) TaxID=353153 RepID=Q4CSF8_TRYCC|nr:hypothetical protein Tc00.1047053509629.30 [Trypanosoma cruzi]EAN83212.1 hypothetical protein Tc00.1047053509629.30 [Trypanosoma cruzi]|eukprot:XP_805063.1 hypothetical protein [Trypanosoma cruzi strain CL Brener]
MSRTSRFRRLSWKKESFLLGCPSSSCPPSTPFSPPECASLPCCSSFPSVAASPWGELLASPSSVNRKKHTKQKIINVENKKDPRRKYTGMRAAWSEKTSPAAP